MSFNKKLMRFPGKTRYGKRLKSGEMSKTEAEYARLLQVKKLDGLIVEWHFEAVTFKLASDCRFTPDFFVVFEDHIEFVDTKGTGPVDPKSVVKIKCAAEKFPWFAFVVETQRAKRDGGGFERKEF